MTKPKTNFDKIKEMTEQELADFLLKFCENTQCCLKCPLVEDCAGDIGVRSEREAWLKWLFREVKQ